jgi:hypothetical protein
MAGLDPAIHVCVSHTRKAWMPATSAGMTASHYQSKFSNSQDAKFLPAVIASASEAIHFAAQGKNGLLRRYRSSQ